MRPLACRHFSSIWRPRDDCSEIMSSHIWVLVLLSQLLLVSAAPGKDKEHNASYWRKQAQEELAKRLERTSGQNDRRVAKNIILFVGDGMGISTLTAARILKGQREGQKGEESRLILEDFPYSGLSKTYCVDIQTAETACAATAYLTGVKTLKGYIALSAKGEPVEPITEWAQREGKATGFITTTTLADHATAVAFAHERKKSNFKEIAEQMVLNSPGNQLEVILGGGLTGDRKDDDLLQHWRDANPQGCFARNRTDLLACHSANKNNNGSAPSPRMMGIFSGGYLKYNKRAPESQPRLTEMVETAIERLAQQPQGFFLFIISGLIDEAHHWTRAGLALDEMLELDVAIEKAMGMTNSSETLIVVTADHSHTLSIANGAKRGTDILGVDEVNSKDDEGVPYSTLNYALGRWNHTVNGKRVNPAPYLKDGSDMPAYIHTIGHHAGEDVPIFANGPQAHLFSGVMEQNLLPHLMGYAGCLGPGAKLCKKPGSE